MFGGRLLGGEISGVLQRILLARLFIVVHHYGTLPLMASYVIQLGGSVFEAGLVVGIFSLVSALSRPLSGYLTDRHGRRFTLLVAIAVILVVTAGYLVVDQVWMVIVVRVFHALGFALVSTATHAVGADVAPKGRLVETMSYVNLSRDLGLALGPVLGTALFGFGGSNLMFFGVGALAILSFLLTLTSVETRPVEAVNASGSSAFLLFEPAAVRPSVVILGMAAVYGAILGFVPLYTQDKQLGPPTLFFTTFAVCVMLLRPVVGKLGDSYGLTTCVVPGLICVSLAMVLVRSSTGSLLLLLAAVIYAFGVALVQPVLGAEVVRAAPPARRGLAVGSFVGANEIAISLGATGGGPLIQLGGYDALFALASVLPLLGLGLYYWLFVIHPPNKAESAP